MSQLAELTAKLKEIFQINRADLDFGIYRILNTRSAEIERYLSETLPRAVKQAFGDNQSEQVLGWKSELEQAKKQAQDLGIDPAQSPKVQDLQNKIEQAKKGSANNETEVYRHLLIFFGRYYEDGDFISQRRYNSDTYAVPYAGEEVLLHWANKDQYYTKSGENFSNYRFKLKDEREVVFRIYQADTAKDNQKDNQAKRLFTLATAQTIERENEDGEIKIIEIQPISQSEDGKTLTIVFDYKPFEKSAKQEKVLEKDLKTLQDHHLLQTTWSALADREPTEKNPNRTLLEKHLSVYTQKNSADYFIHKDLGGFLRRELDFYIKNEVMNLDDIQDVKQFAHIEANLRLIQTLRSIACDIIAFLAQLENFQKKLWLKKKFVAGCHYLITLNHIPERFYDAIFANAKQREQWQNLFAVKDLPPCDLITSDHPTHYAYLVVDTSLFPAEFQSELLTALSAELSDGLDKHINGILIHSDNFGALNLLQARYREQVKCIYIDPPYNTEEDREKGDFLYKDSFEKSTWLAMFENRLMLGKFLLNQNGLLACHMDEHEHLSLEYLIQQTFVDGDMGKLVWDKRNPKGDAKGLSAQHEYVHFATNNVNHLDNENAFVRNKANAEIMLDKVEKLIKKHGISEQTRKEYKEWLKENKDKLSGGEKAYNQIDNNGDIYRPVSMAWPNKKKAPDEYFIPLIHPITQKPCPVPARGWRNPPDTMKKLLDNDLILFGSDETTIPNRKYLLRDNLTENVSSLYYMGSSDDELFKNMGFEFDNPKPIQASKYFLSIIARPINSLILDYFAGSGTTAHAVINLNREDKGNRQYILVEQGEYFDTVLKPRVQKVIYSKAWKDGKPIAEDGAENLQGVPQIVKVLKLESYEDTLNNLELRRSDLFGKLPEQAQNDYLLHYMLNIESRDSLLNVSHFAKPFDYQLKIATNSAGAFDEKNIDLVETFNYLIGATVIGINDKRDEQGFVAVECRLPNQHTDEKTLKTLIFWRDCERIGYDELQKQFDRLRISPADSEYSQVYVNGDHTLETVWDGEQSGSLKIRSIEAEFLALMFAGDE